MTDDTRSLRRLQILRAARACFLDRGYLRTTLSDIVALSGGSRATVYEEFGDKEGLFAALVRSVLDDMGLPSVADGPPAEVLRELGIGYLAQMLDPEALALYRVVLGECGHMRQLGPAIFDAGPKAATDALAARFETWIARGDLRSGDARQLATLFLAMVEGDLHRSAILWARPISPRAIAETVDAAVRVFLEGAAPVALARP
jgi:AcrR family transcriptional regulator